MESYSCFLLLPKSKEYSSHTIFNKTTYQLFSTNIPKALFRALIFYKEDPFKMTILIV